MGHPGPFRKPWNLLSPDRPEQLCLAETRGDGTDRLFYNFVRIHKTLRVTPAIAAGVLDRLWSMEDIAELVEAAAPKPGRPATYRKRETPV